MLLEFLVCKKPNLLSIQTDGNTLIDSKIQRFVTRIL